MPPLADTHDDVVKLTHAAISAHRRSNAAAQVAVGDQIRAFVAGDRANRGEHLVATALLSTALMLRSKLLKRGHFNGWWTVARHPGGFYADPDDAEIVTDLLSAELNEPSTAAIRIINEIADRDLAATCSLIAEAMWAAAHVDIG